MTNTANTAGPPRLTAPATVTDAEGQLVARIAEIDRSGTNAACAFYVYQGFNEAINSDKSGKILTAVNRTPSFWIACQQGWYAAFVAGLGRAYDRRSDTVTPAELIEFCRTYQGMFSLERLRERVYIRMLASRGDAQYAAQVADDFVSDYVEIRAADFSAVSDAVTNATKVYEAKAEDLRHSLAHLPQSLLVTRELPRTGIVWEEAQQLLEMPLRVARSIQESFENGRPVRLNPLDTEARLRCMHQAKSIANKLLFEVAND